MFSWPFLWFDSALLWFVSVRRGLLLLQFNSSDQIPRFIMQSSSGAQLHSDLESIRSEVILQDLNVQSPSPLGAIGGPPPTQGLAVVGSQLSREKLGRDVIPPGSDIGGPSKHQGLIDGKPIHQGVNYDGVTPLPGFMGGAHPPMGETIMWGFP